MNNRLERNRYMLKGSRAFVGYDWWWHNLVAVNEKTQERMPFFIQYMIVNPFQSQKEMILPQTEKDKGKLPSYALMRVGCWGDNKKQILKFYSTNEFEASKKGLDCRIKNNTVTETHLKGSVSVSKEERDTFKEYNSDYGDMSWDLKANKILTYSVGYGASRTFCELNAFRMYWHVGGMKTEYSGTITLNGETYNVYPENSYGYQDKNWGNDYTNPWVWIGCNNFISATTEKQLKMTSLDVGGGAPQVFGIQLPGRLLIAFYYEGKLYEYNFSKFWTGSKETFSFKESDDLITWDIKAKNNHSKIEIHFTCKKDKMIRLDPEGCRGTREHQNLYNGGTGEGYVKLYHRARNEYKLIDTFIGKEAGCELGK